MHATLLNFNIIVVRWNCHFFTLICNLLTVSSIHLHIAFQVNAKANPSFALQSNSFCHVRLIHDIDSNNKELEFYCRSTDCSAKIWITILWLNSLVVKGFFLFFGTFWMKFCYILKYEINLKLEITVQIFRVIIQLNEINILHNSIEYYRRQI